MNVELLKQIKKHILAEPRRLRMNYWISRRKPSKDKVEPPCGTAACLAGWTCVLSKTPASSRTVERKATKLLELDDRQANKLFYTDNWPGEFREQYTTEVDQSGRWMSNFWGAPLTMKEIRLNARTAAKRIDHFIKTKGAE